MIVDFKKILQYAELAKLAYKSNEQILAKHPNAIIKEVAALDLKAFIVPDDKEKVYWLSCRGTDGWENAKLDVEYKKTVHNLLHVPLHEGFYKSAIAIYNKIVRELSNNSYKIRLTGHSLGGAMAVIIMAILDETRKVDNCITFGQPKIGSKKFVKKYRHLPLLRIVNDRDMVPHVPPLTLYSFFDHGPFRHVGKEIYLLDGDSYEYRDEKRAEGIFISSFWLHLRHDKISEHYMDMGDNSYMKNLRIKTIDR